MWLVIGGGMVTLLAAAMRQQSNAHCSGYHISIDQAAPALFLDEADIVSILAAQHGGKIKGVAVSAFNLQNLEQQLEKNTWVKDAELYFDNKDILQVRVTERTPLARVFTSDGKSFYLDADEHMLPLSDRQTASLPVFTGFPIRKRLAAADSLLLGQVRDMASFIGKSAFWMAQVSQVDVSDPKQFELTPVVGNHTVVLGDGTNIEQKMHRLYVFYKDVMSKAGFDRYKTIDVQYGGQVVASRGAVSKVDSIAYRKNILQLMAQSRELPNDTAMPVAPVLERPSAEAATQANTDNDDEINPGTIVNPNPLKLSENKPPANRQPKAVMPPRRTGH